MGGILLLYHGFSARGVSPDTDRNTTVNCYLFCNHVFNNYPVSFDCKSFINGFS